MKRRDLLKSGLAVAAGLSLGTSVSADPTPTRQPIKGWSSNGRWTVEQAGAWYAEQPWVMGYNYVPSTAVNQLETWQVETFDPETIDKELALAASIGLNTARIFLHDLAWKIDPNGFKSRLKTFLDLCEKNKTRALVTFFTNGGPGPHKIKAKPGKQPQSAPGVHNPFWLQSPGVDVVNDPSKWLYLEEYVKDVMGTFANDTRILLWCLYNEPENQRFGEKSLPLMKELWKWAREIAPVHPVTSPCFSLFINDKRQNLPILSFLGENCDVMSFHCYSGPEIVRRKVDALKQYGRPIFCTEYLARPGNNFFNVTPIFKENRVGAIHFGLVNGKCNFQFYGPQDLPEPKHWKHDIFRKDGTPFDPKEIEQIKKLTKTE